MPKRLYFLAALLLLAGTGPALADLTVTVRDAKGTVVATLAVPPGGRVDAVESGAVPAPNPNPDPTPDSPPDTTDPLTAKIQATYAADNSTPSKLVRARQLAAVYRFAAAALSQDPGTKDLKTLLGMTKAASALVLPDDALPGVRRALADELNAAVGRDPATPLDDAKRKQVAAQFARVAKILEAVK